MALGAIIGGALGAVAGGLGSSSSQSSVSGIRVAPETALEKQATGYLGQNLGQLNDLTQAGPGVQDQTNYLNSSRSLASLLQSYSQGGYLPTAADTASASGLADQLLNPSFRQQGVEADRLAARLGRPVNDPIIQNKLRQGLADVRSSFIAQRAQQMPLERLGFAQQYASVNQGLASQAFANRQALLQAGNTLREADRAYRINTGERYGETSQSSGGGLGGAISGALGGAGAGLAFQNALNSFNNPISSGGGVGGFASPGGFSSGGFGIMGGGIAGSAGGYGLGGMDYSFNPTATAPTFPTSSLGVQPRSVSSTPQLQQFKSASSPAGQGYAGYQQTGGSGLSNTSIGYNNSQVPASLASPDLYNQAAQGGAFNPYPNFNIYGGY